MIVTTNNYGDITENGNYAAELTGIFYKGIESWIWETKDGADVYLSEEQHLEMIQKYEEWRKI